MTNPAAEANLGPALALIDATLDGDRNQLRLLHGVFGNHTLTDSSSELTHRFLRGSGALDDIDSLMALWDEHLGHWTRYQDVAVTWLDARLRWTWALIHARRFTRRHLNNYFRHASFDAEAGVVASTANRYIANPRTIPTGFTYTVGLAYSTTMTALRLAEYDDADISERLRAYRAQAAREAAEA